MVERTKPRTGSAALLSARELADYASVSESMIRELIRRGELPAVKLGRLTRVRLEDFLAYLEAHRIRRRSAPPLPVLRAAPRTTVIPRVTSHSKPAPLRPEGQL